MTDVIKKDKRKEPFDAEKIKKSIELAAKESNISDERAKELVEQVSKLATEMAEKESEIETSAIRERILKELDTLEPAVSEAWRNYDQNKPAKS